MPSVEEISAWSVDELITEIKVLLPSDQALSIEPQSGYWVVRVIKDEELIQEETNLDQRLALLNVFGSLWASSGVSEDSPWCRKRELPRSSIPESSLYDASDPEDLNPDEIQAFYKH
jgi:hypothetical protein